MKQKIARFVKQYVLLTLVLFTLFLLAKIIAYSIPTENVRKNISDSVAMMEEEGLHPQVSYKTEETNIKQVLDNWTDAIFLNVAYGVGNRGLLETVAGDFTGGKGQTEIELLRYRVNVNGDAMWTYERQWFGAESVLRPLLYFFNLAEIRWLSQSIFFILVLTACQCLVERTIKSFGLMYGLSIAVVAPYALSSSINLMMSFYVAVIATIVACKRFKKNSSVGTFMFVVGACTSYFDLFITPIVSFGIVTVVLLALSAYTEKINSYKSAVLQIFYSGLAWGCGYFILWSTKWAFSSVILKRNVFADAINEILFMSSKGGVSYGPDSAWGYITESLRLNINNMFPVNLFSIIGRTIGMGGTVALISLLVIGLGVFWYKNHKPWKQMYLSFALLLVALVPYAYYVIIHVHTFIHYWAEYRYQCTSLMGICGAYIFSLDTKKGNGFKPKTAELIQKLNRIIHKLIIDELKKTDKLIVCISLFLWTFFAERVYFNCPIYYNNWVYIVAKILCGLLIVGLIELVERLKSSVRRKDERTMRVLRNSLVVFVVYTVILLLVWPGNWFGDGMLVLSSARNFEIVWLQGIAASIWYIIWLMLIPIPSFLTIVNIIGVSILSGILIYETGRVCNKSKWFRYVSWLFVFNPCVIYFMLYSHRSVDVGIMETLTAVFVLYKICDNKEMDLFETFFVAIMVGVFPCFRTETVLVSIALILACFLSHRISGVHQKGILIVLPIVIIVSNYIVSSPHRETYDMAYMYKPLPYYIQQSDKLRGEQIESDLEKLGKVFDIEKIRMWEVSYVHNWSWGGGVFCDGFTKEEFLDAKKAFWDITINNMDLYLEIRWNCFKATMGVDEKDGIHFLLRSHHEFWKDYEFYDMQTVKGFALISEKIRLKVLNGLMLCNVDNIRVFDIAYRFFFNGIPAIIGILGMAVKFRKNYGILLINVGFMLLALALFLLTPEASLQYYVSILLYGNGVFWYICMWCWAVKNKKHMKIQKL